MSSDGSEKKQHKSVVKHRNRVRDSLVQAEVGSTNDLRVIWKRVNFIPMNDTIAGKLFPPLSSHLSAHSTVEASESAINARSTRSQNTRAYQNASLQTTSTYGAHLHRHHDWRFIDKLQIDHSAKYKVISDGEGGIDVGDFSEMSPDAKKLSEKLRNDVMKELGTNGHARKSVGIRQAALIGLLTNANFLRKQEDLCFDNDGRFKDLFSAVEVHCQEKLQASTEKYTLYDWHKDPISVSKLVAFVQLSGESYTFVQVGKNDRFSDDFDSLWRWRSYHNFGHDDNETLNAFLIAGNNELKPGFEMKCVRLLPGHILIFAASDMIHGSVIVRNLDGMPRQLAIFHCREKA